MIDLNALPLGELYAELCSTGLVGRLFDLARDEDLGPGGRDVTGMVTLDPGDVAAARLRARQAGVAAGLACIPGLIGVFCGGSDTDDGGVSWQPATADGDRFAAGDTLGTLAGPTAQIVRVERTLLNLISRLSGIATRTARFVEQVDGTGASVLDTRKTTPGLRVFEKYAVRCGGGLCHRLGLFDAVLIKDNHIAGLDAAGVAQRVSQAAHKARTIPIRAESGSERSSQSTSAVPARCHSRLVAGDPELPLRFVEVEVDSIEQLKGVLTIEDGLVDIVLLDNFSVEQLREAVALRAAVGASPLFEASGGVSLDTICAIAQTGVERISVGGLTHQATSLDLGLDIG